MERLDPDATFAGSIPELYEAQLVPLIFQHYAADLARRAAELRPARVLETAAGTGVVTRALAQALPERTEIVASDLNGPMLERAATLLRHRAVQWKQADAMALPFDDGAFDAVVCQFGVMFFPDKARAFAEAWRVLRPGGALLFNAWDRIEQNEFADVVTSALARLFPADPPRFLARIPHGYCDPAAIAADLARGGFASSPDIVTIAARSRAASPRVPAMGYCQGTPLRSEIEARSRPGLADATAACEAAIAERFGRGPVDGKIQALVVVVTK